VGYFFIFLVVFLTAYSQLIIKWQLSIRGQFPDFWDDQIRFVFRLMVSPWVISAFLAGCLSFVAWSVALTKLDLTRAYPLTTLSFVIVMLSGALLFHESLTIFKLLGMTLIIVGIAVASQG